MAGARVAGAVKTQARFIQGGLFILFCSACVYIVFFAYGTRVYIEFIAFTQLRAWSPIGVVIAQPWGLLGGVLPARYHA